MNWPAPQRKQYGRLDLNGTIVRCDLHLPRPLRPNEALRLYHDGSTWALWTFIHPVECLATFPSAEVARIVVHQTTTFVRQTPTWAKILGVIGLFFFLIGIVFFFVKENVPTQATLLEVTLADGSVVALRAFNSDPAALRVAVGADA